MLNIGDKIVYPMHGAGIISGIEECEVLGDAKTYYVLELPLGNVKVMIPTDGLDKAGLRSVISAEEVQNVADILQSKPDRVAGSWNKRYHTNLERMKSGNLGDVAAVARNLLWQDRKKRISGGERRLLDLSKQILVSELVYALDKEPEEAEAWLIDMIERANRHA